MADFIFVGMRVSVRSALGIDFDNPLQYTGVYRQGSYESPESLLHDSTTVDHYYSGRNASVLIRVIFLDRNLYAVPTPGVFSATTLANCTHMTRT